MITSCKTCEGKGYVETINLCYLCGKETEAALENICIMHFDSKMLEVPAESLHPVIRNAIQKLRYRVNNAYLDWSRGHRPSKQEELDWKRNYFRLLIEYAKHPLDRWKEKDV